MRALAPWRRRTRPERRAAKVTTKADERLAKPLVRNLQKLFAVLRGRGSQATSGSGVWRDLRKNRSRKVYDVFHIGVLEVRVTRLWLLPLGAGLGLLFGLVG